jgi:flagellar hook assembly protein FlgD
VETDIEGYYTLFQNSDNVGPAVEISVEGQIYTEQGYVARQPKISAVIQDAGGVNMTPEGYWVRVDGDTTELGEVTTNSLENGQVLNLSYRPNQPFPVGTHTLSVYAEDLSGNPGSKTIQFKVMGDFRLDFLGNYPNPFKDKTHFTYRLTEQTTAPVEVKIYTVSGRLIRTLQSLNPEEINYGEIYWDGRDQDGHLIANGVYFYKFTARRGGDEIERIMTLAKLR